MSLPGAVGTGLEIRRLERTNNWIWGLNIVLLGLLSLTVALLYLTYGDLDLPAWLPAPQSAGMLAAGLCGLTILFALYMVHKQSEVSKVRKQLLNAQVREESVRSRLSGVSSLFDASAQLMEHIDLGSVLELVAQRVRTCMDADQSSFFLLDKQSRELVCRAAAGFEADSILEKRVPLGEGISGYVTKSNETLHLNESQIAQRSAFEVPIGVSSIAAVPVSVEDSQLGAILVARFDPADPLLPADVRALATFGGHVATTISRIEVMGSLGAKTGQLREVNLHLAQQGLGKERILHALEIESQRPLSRVSRGAEIMLQGGKPLSPERRVELGRIFKDQATQLSQLIEDSLELVRLQNRTARLQPLRVEFNGLVEDLMLLTELDAAIKGVHIESDLDPHVPEIELDEPTIHRAISSLLASAVILCDSGNTVWVLSHYQAPWVEFEVLSGGARISPALRDKLFDLPQKEDVSGFHRIQSMGLQLYLANRVVELHGGKLWAEEVAEKGIRLRMRLPAEVANTQMTEKAAA